MTPAFTSLYTHNRERSKAFSTVNTEESMTQQSDAADTDINIIMKKYGASGQLPQVQVAPLFGDFTTALDFREMQEKIREGKNAFEELPVDVRRRFGYDPAEFIAFATEPANKEELRKMGIEPPAPAPVPEPPPMRVHVVTYDDPKPDPKK